MWGRSIFNTEWLLWSRLQTNTAIAIMNEVTRESYLARLWQRHSPNLLFKAVKMCDCVSLWYITLPQVCLYVERVTFSANVTFLYLNHFDETWLVRTKTHYIKQRHEEKTAISCGRESFCGRPVQTWSVWGEMLQQLIALSSLSLSHTNRHTLRLQTSGQ